MLFKKYAFLQSIIIIITWLLGLFFLVYSGNSYSFFGENITENYSQNIFYFIIFCFFIFLIKKNNLKVNYFEFIFITLSVISLFTFLITGETEFFWPFILPLCLIGIDLSKFKLLLKKILLLTLFLHYLYILQLYFFSIDLIDPILVNQKIIDYYFTGNEFRFSLQFFYIHSNAAGAILFAYYILIDSLYKSNNLKYKILVIPLIIISGSLSSILITIIYEITTKISLKLNLIKLFFIMFVGIIILYNVIQYISVINEIGILVRLERIFSFIFHFLTNPYILLFPNYIINGSFYTESSLLDLFLNFGIFSFPLFYLIYSCRATRYYLIILFLTSASYTPMSSLILYIIYNVSKNKT
tara:strand:+ start:20825 stop:21892 length:1068 start_codon:yes stop_codon:yes gene_type:complete